MTVWACSRPCAWAPGEMAAPGEGSLGPDASGTALGEAGASLSQEMRARDGPQGHRGSRQGDEGFPGVRWKQRPELQGPGAGSGWKE